MNTAPPNVPAPPRVVVTAAARALLRTLAAVHGPLMLHQSGGCCDGSAPMCFPVGEFVVGDHDVLLGVLDLRLAPGEIGAAAPRDADAVPVWISGPQFRAWQHTALVVDVVPGRGAGFSLEAPEGVRLLSRGRVFDAAERDLLARDIPIRGADWEQGTRPGLASAPTVVAEAADACPTPTGRV